MTLLSVRGLSKEFVSRRGFLRRSDRHLALKDVSFDLAPGEILGLVGESGSGKTTLGRCVQRLIEPSAGDVVFDGTSLRALPSKALRVLRRRIAFVFQDPYASLNPRLTVGRIVGEPIENSLPRGEPSRAEVANSNPSSRKSDCPRMRRVGTRTSSRAVSDSGSASRGRSLAIRTS